MSVQHLMKDFKLVFAENLQFENRDVTNISILAVLACHESEAKTKQTMEQKTQC